MTKNLSFIKSKVESYLIQSVHVKKEKIKDDTLIFKEGYLDSLGLIQLIAFIEEEFGIKTGDADLIEENFESINAITSFIDRKSKS